MSQCRIFREQTRSEPPWLSCRSVSVACSRFQVNAEFIMSDTRDCNEHKFRKYEHDSNREYENAKELHRHAGAGTRIRRRDVRMGEVLPMLRTRICCWGRHVLWRNVCQQSRLQSSWFHRRMFRGHNLRTVGHGYRDRGGIVRTVRFVTLRIPNRSISAGFPSGGVNLIDRPSRPQRFDTVPICPISLASSESRLRII